MSRERFSGKDIIASGVLFIATLAVGDRVIHGQVNATREHSVPVAILPDRIVLFAPPKGLKDKLRKI